MILDDMKTDEEWLRLNMLRYVLSHLGSQLETAAALQLCFSMGYQRGYDHGSTLQGFCEPSTKDAYFPLDMRFWKGVKCE